jgi:hypothetical protein
MLARFRSFYFCITTEETTPFQRHGMAAYGFRVKEFVDGLCRKSDFVVGSIFPLQR